MTILVKLIMIITHDFSQCHHADPSKEILLLIKLSERLASKTAINNVKRLTRRSKTEQRSVIYNSIESMVHARALLLMPFTA